ncbi:MAG: glycosyltransferase family 10 [Hylemonella sp.]|nr:glycosyltransferase family 10 [Hylemonella sp.]
MIYANIHADGHSNNSLFGLEDSVHRYNPTYTPRLLRDRLLEQGIELNTPDVNQGRPVAFDLHLEGRPLTPQVRPRYLIALENPNINKLNASPSYCEAFDLAFAWDIRLHHLPNVVPIMIPHPMIWQNFPGPQQRQLFSCLINANKAFKEVLDTDLYRERLVVIRWYERHAPDHFELYGLGWDKPTPAYTLAGRLRRGASRLQSRLFGTPPFPSFRGEIRDKADVLKRARFSFCYENNRDVANYITEKMLDSLVNGCVPVYWGADNVLNHVPADCFIDRRQFRDTADVHRYLLTIDDTRYRAYQDAIRAFLGSSAAQTFRSGQIIQTITDHIQQDLRQRELM